MTQKKENPAYVVRTFGGYSARQTEVVVIGPFEKRKYATIYNKLTKKRARPQTMHDFMLDTKVTTRPPKERDFSHTPSEYTMYEVYEECGETE